MSLWIKKSDGTPDASLTIAMVTMAVVLIKVLLAGAAIGPFSFGSIDAGVIAALLTPTLGAYVARRYTDANAPVKE